MKLVINGAEQAFEGIQTITQLLEKLGFAGKPVVVELNKQALFPREFESIQLSDGDLIEIITIAAGG